MYKNLEWAFNASIQKSSWKGEKVAPGPCRLTKMPRPSHSPAVPRRPRPAALVGKTGSGGGGSGMSNGEPDSPLRRPADSVLTRASLILTSIFGWKSGMPTLFFFMTPSGISKHYGEMHFFKIEGFMFLAILLKKFKMAVTSFWTLLRKNCYQILMMGNGLSNDFLPTL